METITLVQQVESVCFACSLFAILVALSFAPSNEELADRFRTWKERRVAKK